MEANTSKGTSEFHQMLGAEQKRSGRESDKAGSVGRHPAERRDRKKAQEDRRRVKLSRTLKNLAIDTKDYETIVPSVSHAGVGRTLNFNRRLPRKWIMAPIVNPAREDDLSLCHWVREEDVDKEYPFARLNAVVSVPTYTDEQYAKHLIAEGWTKETTDELMRLAKVYELRWILIADRWPDTFPPKSLDDLRERYYRVHNILEKMKESLTYKPDIIYFDFANERLRREQLEKLWNRTKEQVEEERALIKLHGRIQSQKQEREKNILDLQKLISTQKRTRKEATPRRKSHPKGPPKSAAMEPTALKKESTEPRFSSYVPLEELDKPEPSHVKLRLRDPMKSGVTLRSQRVRLVPLLGSNRIKAIEQGLEALKLPETPVVLSEKICDAFNDLRADLLRLYEHKCVLVASQYELETLLQEKQKEMGEGAMDVPCTSSCLIDQSGKEELRIADAMVIPITTEARKHRKASKRSESRASM